jgi:hypothetical protein
MDVKIGVLHTPKEIDIDLGDEADADKLVKDVESALSGGEGKVLWVTDRRGRRVGIPASKVAYIEIGAGTDRRVGFGTH